MKKLLLFLALLTASVALPACRGTEVEPEGPYDGPVGTPGPSQGDDEDHCDGCFLLFRPENPASLA